MLVVVVMRIQSDELFCTTKAFETCTCSLSLRLLEYPETLPA